MKKLIPVICACCLLTIVGHAATRVAVVDVGATAKIPATFLDLLMVELGKQPDVALLERADVNRLLREQSLSLGLTGEQAVKAGRLWTTDAFVMLETGTNGAVRVRVVDTRYGLKLWDTGMLLGANNREFASRAALLAQEAASRLRKLACGASDPILVSVAAFRREDLAPQWDSLTDDLAMGIEQHLALLPRIVVLERGRTRPLTEERELVAGLPPELLASSVLVDGAVRVNHDTGAPTVTLNLRCRRGSVEVLATELRGSLENPVELSQRAAAAVVAAMAGKIDCTPIDPQVEAAALAAEAADCLKLHEAEHALALTEAALALAPQSVAYQRLLLEAIGSIRKAPPDLLLLPGAIPKPPLDWLVMLAMRGLPLAESAIRRGEHDDWIRIYNFLDQFHNWFPTDAARRSLREQAAFDDVRAGYWRVWKLWHAALDGQAPMEKWRSLHIANADIWLCRNPDEAFTLSRQVVTEFVALFKNYPQGQLHGLDGLLEALPVLFQQPDEGRARFAAYLTEMTQAPDPLVRFHAESVAALFYGPSEGPHDYAQALAHAGRSIDLFKSAIATNYPAAGLPLTIYSTHFAADTQSDDKIRMRFLQDLAEFGLREHLFERQPFDWGQLAVTTANLLESFGDSRAAASLAERGIAVLPATTMWHTPLQDRLRDLKRLHPELATNNVAPPLAAVRLWTAKEAVGAREVLRLRRIMYNDDVAAIVYAFADNSERYEQFGVLRLDRNSWKPLSNQVAPDEMRLNTRTANLSYDYLGFGPVVTAIGKDVFVGHPLAGVLASSADGTNTLFNEKHGLASQKILSLTAMDGKLYALIGDPINDSGVMEIDPQNGTSRILFSTRTKEPKLPLDGHPIRSFAADPQQHALWVLIREDQTTRLYLYRYWPATNKAERHTIRKEANLSWFQDNFFTYAKMVNNQLFILTPNGSYKLDPQTDQFTPVFARIESEAASPPWFKQFGNSTPPRSLIPMGANLLGIEGWELELFRAGRPDPEYLLDRLFPNQPKMQIMIQDVAMTPQGLLLLTADALYLVRDLKP